MCWPPGHPILKQIGANSSPELLLCHKCGRMSYLPLHPADQYEVYKSWYHYYDDTLDKDFYLCAVCKVVIEQGE